MLLVLMWPASLLYDTTLIACIKISEDINRFSPSECRRLSSVRSCQQRDRYMPSHRGKDRIQMATNLLITSSRMQVPAVQNAVLSEKFILNIETEQSGSVAKVTGRHFDSGIQLRQHVQLTFLCLEVIPSRILYPGHSMLTYYRVGQPKLFK